MPTQGPLYSLDVKKVFDTAHELSKDDPYWEKNWEKIAEYKTFDGAINSVKRKMLKLRR